MAFIRTATPEEVTGAAATIYGAAVDRYGYLPNMVKVFSHAPEVFTAWQALVGAVSARMDPRRYELVTMAAARELGSSYCLLAHGGVLLQQGMPAAEIAALAAGGEAALTEQERAVMEFAAHVVRDAGGITEAEVAALRGHGLGEAEIFDIAAAAALRCFFSKTLDAMGARPDRIYRDLPQVMQAALQPGRRIED